MDRLTSALPGHYSPQHASLRKQEFGAATEVIRIGIDPNDAAFASRNGRSAGTTGGNGAAAGTYSSSRSRHTPLKDHLYDERVARQQRDPNDVHRGTTRARSARSRSPTKRSKSPSKSQPVSRSHTGDLKVSGHHQPSHHDAIDVELARRYKPSAKRVIMVEGSPDQPSQETTLVRPKTPPPRFALTTASPPLAEPEYDDDDSLSYYSEDDFGQARPSYISPLRVRKQDKTDDSMLRSAFNAWSKPQSPERQAREHRPTGQSTQQHGLQKTATAGDILQDEFPRSPRNYSPLSEYLTNQLHPTRKQLIGTHGWLERTTAPAATTEGSKQQEASEEPSQQKKRGFLNNLMKIAKGVTTSAKDMTSSAARKTRENTSRVSSLTVSLDPREQSLLYCELEFLLTTALDSYISSQFNSGRLDADKYKKVVDGWQQRGRPKVVGFRYDLETQLDLVLLHSEEFRFYGKRAGLIAVIHGVLDMMRVDARAMRIRTFCQPDTVIAKQLLDAQSLYNLVGCSEQQQIQLAEVIQFFKVIIEREQVYRSHKVPEHLDQNNQRDRAAVNAGTGAQGHKKISSLS
ncbi:hypothetical protein BD289DRAFT_485692 [Coniella lustricola]|uniref:Uncharacterized protein n=1 Tax=Coniella lustricola TaxID=2025994 RepID=A0A2T2ZXU5_9PEZI|nr:hypothetical protein BD289DRAFT_485692 [Coniella lustricola]